MSVDEDIPHPTLYSYNLSASTLNTLTLQSQTNPVLPPAAQTATAFHPNLLGMDVVQTTEMSRKIRAKDNRLRSNTSSKPNYVLQYVFFFFFYGSRENKILLHHSVNYVALKNSHHK